MSELAISLDPKPINDILNADGVREWHVMPGAQPGEKIDVSPLMDTGGFSIVGDGMGWMFNEVGVGTYEVHTAVLPHKRGAGTLSAVRECARHVFLKTDCMEVLTRCPVNNPTAIKLAEKTGFIHLYTAKRAFGGIDMEVYSYPLSVWAATATEFRASGEWVHDQFHAENSAHADHPEDALHHQYAGLALEMARNGNAPKGMHLYNLWAQMSGYEQIGLMCLDPVVFRVPWWNEGQWEFFDYALRADKLERL